MLPAAALGAGAKAAAVSARQFPAGFFYQHQKIALADKAALLDQTDNTLKRLNKEGVGLMVKGSIIEPLRTDIPTYERLTILDESGLIVIVRRAPNIYYGLPAHAPLNKNVFLIVKNARVDKPESYIRYGFVVQGDFGAYPQKYVAAIIEGLESAVRQNAQEQPGPPGPVPASSK
jgi:hypothetical protein